jgi:putative Mg2+ transporter-C (MgtC) family protein
MTLLDAFLRLGAAIAVAGAIGLNRDLRGKPAGVRTHALVGLGSALATLVAGTSLAGEAGDPSAVSRVMQGIITGIGFLGAGVILHRNGGRTVRGLTTAASIWVVAALGIACGAAQWGPVVAGTALTLLVLVAGGPLERAMHRLTGKDARPQEPASPPASGDGSD